MAAVEEGIGRENGRKALRAESRPERRGEVSGGPEKLCAKMWEVELKAGKKAGKTDF